MNVAKSMGQRPMLRPRLTSFFEKEFAKLNPAQKKAVETIEGPLMVLAGPGTGKTQIVAMRVANILKKTQMRPSNILCLTYTKSGAAAMRDRLRGLIGPDAYGVTIDTIHGFCNTTITSHPEIFEDFGALEHVSDIERYRIIHRIIDELMPDCILVPRKFPYSRTKDIIDRISLLKREGVTDRARLLKISEEYTKTMQTMSRAGSKQQEKDLRTARKFRELLEVFFRYQEILQEEGRYDYEDMILRIIEALEDDEMLLASLKERYQYILLDEAQDCNGAQWKLLHILTSDPDRHPNFFIVADDDQAIFRFQGAHLQSLLTFQEKFPKAPIVTLEESYRCTQSILDAAHSLIAKNSERLVGKVPGITKDLRSAVGKKGSDPVLLRPPSDMSEPWLVADIIEERLRKGVSPQEIAIIVQTNAELPILYDVLSSRKIPVEMSGKVDLLSHPLIREVISILRAIENPDDDHIFLNALSCSSFGLPALDLVRLHHLAREKTMSPPQLVTALKHKEIPDRTFFEEEKLLKAAETLLALHVHAPNRTVLETLERIFHECNLRNPLDIAVAQEFFDRMKQRAYEQPNFSLPALLSDLAFYASNDYKDLRLTYDLPHLVEEGVQLLTAHKSKGLEFHTVILPNFREGHWEKRRRPASISIPEDLLFGWSKEQRAFEQSQDERRLAYVAMTRAKNELIFTCPLELTTGDSLKSVSPSGFFAEAGNLPEEHRAITSPEEASTLLHPVVHDSSLETRAFLLECVKNFSLSPSALNDFLEDPKQFLDKHLLRLPEAREPSYAYGNAIHHILAEWGTARMRGNSMSEKEVLQKFSEHLEKREVLTTPERKRLEQLGRESLSRYYASHLKETSAYIHRVEFPLHAHLPDPKDLFKEGIPLKGKIDRIDLRSPNDRRAIVYDYKTGKPKMPAEIEKYGYRRQLLFYDLLIRQALPLLDPEEFVLSFVGEEGEVPLERSYTFTDSERREFVEVIRAVWGKIVALDFTPL